MSANAAELFVNSFFEGSAGAQGAGEIMFPFGTVTPHLAPVVSNFTPIVGTPIAASGTVGFNVTDPNSLPFQALVIVAAFVGGLVEVVFTGTVFTPFYSGSSAAAIAQGFSFVLLRSGGWPSGPTITVYGIDTAGNEDQ